MRPILLVLTMLCMAPNLFAQYVYTIKADSVKITNNCDTAELILENHTQNVLGFLYNKGKGRTEFRKIIKLNDSTLLFGDDTITLKKNIFAQNGLSKTADTIQLGQDLVYGTGPASLLSDREIPLGEEYSVYFTGPPSLHNSEYVSIKRGAIGIQGNSGYVYAPHIRLKDDNGFGPGDSVEISLTGGTVVPDAGYFPGAFNIQNFTASNPTIATQNTFIMHTPWGSSGNQLQINGEPLSGNANGNGMYITRQWNTTGTVNAIRVNIFNTASHSASKLISLETFDSPKFSVNTTGVGMFADTVFAPKLFLTNLNSGTGSDSLLVKTNTGEIKKVSQTGISSFLNRVTVTDANYSAVNSDYLVAYVSLSAGRTVTLPSASTMSNKMIIIKDESGSAGTHNITIDGFGSETIDGSATKLVNSNFGSITIYSNGADWFTIHQ